MRSESPMNPFSVKENKNVCFNAKTQLQNHLEHNSFFLEFSICFHPLCSRRRKKRTKTKRNIGIFSNRIRSVIRSVPFVVVLIYLMKKSAWTLRTETASDLLKSKCSNSYVISTSLLQNNGTGKRLSRRWVSESIGFRVMLIERVCDF